MNDPLKHERELRTQGFERIAGVDEAGRGALAGPMVAAAVILPLDFPPGEIADSKEMGPWARELEYARLLAGAVAIGTAWMTASTIDESVLAGSFDDAHRDLLRRAINALHPPPDFVLIDAYDLPNLGIESRSFPHADATSLTVAAASIVAKVTRDRAMEDLDLLFPAWGFARHKGYGGGSGEHAAALEANGLSPIHRRSFVEKHASKTRVSAVLRQGRSGWGPDDLEEATYVWLNLHPDALTLMEILVDSSEAVDWRRLANALGPAAQHDTVVGTFGPPAGLAKRVGRTKPVYVETTPAGTLLRLDPIVQELFQRIREGLVDDGIGALRDAPASTTDAATRITISAARAFEENKRRVLAGEIQSHKTSDWRRRFRRK